MSADALEQAFASSAKVLASVQAGDLDKATPCATWKVRDVVNHMVGGTHFFAETAETGVAPTAPSETDFASGDISSAYAAGSARAVAAFRAEGAMDKTMKLPFGEFPGAIFVMIAASDAFTHGWDVAKSLGQSTDLDPQLAAQLLAMSMIPDEFRGADGLMPFGPKVEAPESATAADKLAAYLGRSV
jgi:uncharacterized protein (TIGR03086 family)